MSGIAPAPAPPFGILFKNIWTRSDPSMTIPLLDDSSGQEDTISNDFITNPDPASQSLQHSTDNNDSSTSIVTDGTTEPSGGIEDPMARGDVFAGVIVFSVGMMALIVAVTFYFTKRSSLRTVRQSRGLENNRSSAQLRWSRGGGADGAIEEVGAGDVDLEQNAHAIDITAGTGAEPGKSGKLEKVTTFDAHSPSIARLTDHRPSSPSVFAFLKGTPSPSLTSPSSSSSPPSHHNCHPSNLSLLLKRSQIGASSVIPKTGNDFDSPTESTTLHMPVLTRTKARSSCKKKSKGMISLFSSSNSSGMGSKKHKQLLQAAAAIEIARSASAIIIQIQEPSEPSSAAPLTPIDTHNHHHHHHHTSSNPTFPLDQENSLEETASSIHPISTTPSTADNHHHHRHPLLRLEMPTTVRSSSVVGLYGSAKSSPNGSMVDAASTRAIYCTSVKSAISFLPTESTSMLGVTHTTDLGGGGTGVGVGQGIAIATAGLES
ncbi:hypothetical protein KI688_007345 [Linnemannia hyalina]|uniref:Uncharacterized protein n=1 Tax=Linnemannia hyalina TaxID=64524 RepID=A0A9P7XI81_9FUNG|nr:hypothetical protein KI688_007345 [Linnemannia hyalina]